MTPLQCRSRRGSRILFFVTALLPGGLSGAIQIDGYSATVNDRYTDSSSFIADGFDLSGVARGAHASDRGKWVTMLSGNVFLSANHWFPDNGTSLTFYAGNDSAGASLARTVSGSQRIGTSDLRIGHLDSPLSATYAHYDFASTGINSQTDLENSAYYEANAYLFGRSPEWEVGDVPGMAVGRNEIDHWFPSVLDGSTTRYDVLAAVRNEPTDPGYVTNEAYLQTFDSGGPLFVDNGGQLELVGINWLIEFDDFDIGGSTVTRDYSGFSYVGNYATEIQSYIDAHPVPEPAMFALLLGTAVGVAVMFRRRRTQTVQC